MNGAEHAVPAADGFRSDSEDSEGFHVFNEETDVESFITPIDHEEDGLNVFIEFKRALEGNEKNSEIYSNFVPFQFYKELVPFNSTNSRLWKAKRLNRLNNCLKIAFNKKILLIQEKLLELEVANLMLLRKYHRHSIFHKLIIA